MYNKDNVKWTFWAISHAVEPGDAVYTGMRHRGFDVMMLVLCPDNNGGGCSFAAEMPRSGMPWPGSKWAAWTTRAARQCPSPPRLSTTGVGLEASARFWYTWNYRHTRGWTRLS